MPIQVHIEINGKPIESIHIARDDSVAVTENNEATYIAVRRKSLPTESHRRIFHRSVDIPSEREWSDGSAFTHVREDGVETLLHKALHALEIKYPDIDYNI